MKYSMWVLGIVLLLASYGCRSTKYVPEGAHLLQKIEIDNKAKDISRNELEYYLRQEENMSILGFWRFHLGLYNLSGRDERKGINKWLRKIGEAPVLYDELLREKSSQQLKLFLNNKGYYNANVIDTVIYKGKKKARVKFRIEPGERYTVNRLSYRVDDENIKEAFFADTASTLLKYGAPFDSELHDQERQRITRKLRNKGYYAFRKEFVYFLADSALGRNRVNDSLIVMKNRLSIGKDRDTLVNHQKYKIKNVYFVVGYNPRKALQDEDAYLRQFDTLQFSNCHIMYADNLNFRADVLINSNYIFPGQYYSQERAEKTQMLLADLDLFRFINIRFRHVGEQIDDDGNRLLNCYIQLSRSKVQSYTVEVEGTNSSGNLGAAGGVKYRHNNLFRGGEVFDMRIRGAQENQGTDDKEEKSSFNTMEIGADASLSVPKFMVPFKIESFRKKYNPKTSFSLAYNYQRRPDYTRAIANTRLAYNWRGNRRLTHTLSPLDLSLVSVSELGESFAKRIGGTYLENSYKNHLISSSSYTLTYKEQEIKGGRNYQFFQFNIESAGNIIDLASRFIGKGRQKNHGEVLGIRYAQYVKGDVDWRYHLRVNSANSFAYRFFLGVGYPYGNLTVLPFEKRYFSGGANGIRAWPVRGLGPGSFVDTESTYYNQTADIKLEMNAEYRFKLFWLIEGALFVDMGNIWTIRSSGDKEMDVKGMFHFDQFHKQIAVGVGSGIRFDFNYFVFRLDMGIKARDPSMPAGKRWLLGTDPITNDDVTFNFAIGYPF